MVKETTRLRNHESSPKAPSPKNANSKPQGALGRSRFGLLWAAVLFVAVAARLSTWWEVFAPDRIRFMADTDPHYHLLRALRIVENFPHIPWTDSEINFPLGAIILWPPLFDLLIALPAKLLGGGRATAELVAVWIPVALGLITLLLVGALGKALGERHTGLVAAAVLAVLPANLEFTLLGRVDQHALELVASCWVMLAFLYSWRKGATWTRATSLGLAIVVAFWNWQGSGFYLVLLAGFLALWHLLGFSAKEHHPARAVAQGATIGSAVLALSVVLFTPHGFGAMHIMGVTGFHVILVALMATFAWLLALLPAKVPVWRRLAEITLSALAPLVASLILVPGFQESVKRGLAALTAGNAWYADIREFAPLVLDGIKPLTVELAAVFHHFGLLLAVAPLCMLVLVKRWRERPEKRPETFFLLYWGFILLILTFLRVRFNLYAVIPLALWLAVAIDELATWIQSRSAKWGGSLSLCVPVLAAFLVVLPAASFLAPGTFREPSRLTVTVPLLRWLRGVPAPTPHQAGVLAPWAFGHAIRYYAHKPVLTTPFGTDGGAKAMEDSAQFFLATNPDAAELLLQRRQIGFLLLSNPADEIFTLYPFSGFAAPSPLRRVSDVFKGGTLIPGKNFRSLVVSRLYFLDGSGDPRSHLPALGGYRLLYETSPVRGKSGLSQIQIKLFAVVPGARVMIDHAQPDRPVTVTIPIVTNQGRPFAWTAVGRTDAAGRATVRVPYATGNNGLVRALPCTVSDGQRSTQFVLSEQAVVDGATVTVDLSAHGASSRKKSTPNTTQQS